MFVSGFVLKAATCIGICIDVQMEFVALQKIKCALSEWVARRLHELHPNAHPNSTRASFWRRHPTTYRWALVAARSARLVRDTHISKFGGFLCETL